MKANRKFVEGREAVSAVIGVILMVAITVAIAAVVYIYVSGLMTGTPTATPSVALTADPSGENCTITLGSPTQTSIKWDDVNWTLVNVTDGKDITANLSISGPGTTTLSGGQVISIKKDDFGLKSGNVYRFTLIYKKTGGIMGSVTWTQP